MHFMKKITFYISIGVFICSGLNVNLFAQGQGETGNPHWNTGGNNASATDYFGTKNTRPVIFKTDGVERLRITETGFIGIDEPNPTERLHIKGNAKVVGNFASTGTLEVSGTATFKDKLTAEKGVMFDNNNGITFAPADGSSPSILTFGKKPPQGFSFTDPCLNPTPDKTYNAFKDFITIWANTSAGQVNAMSVGVDGGNGYIDMAGPGAASANLLLNYHCGKDVFICTGTNGGEVNMGAGAKSKINISGNTIINGKVGIATDNPQETFQIGDRFTIHNGGNKVIGYNFKFEGQDKRIVTDEASAIYFADNGDININTSGNGTADSPITWTRALTIKNDGKVGISTDYIPVDYKLAVDGKIIATEVVVKLRNAWPDYVFSSTYQRMSWKEKEKYFKLNNRLPGIKSASELEKDGLTLAETMTGLTVNVEENSLEIIELYKENEKLKEELKNLNKKLEMLINKNNQ